MLRADALQAIYPDLEDRIVHIVRNWHDELRDILLHKHGEEKGGRLASRFGKALCTVRAC